MIDLPPPIFDHPYPGLVEIRSNYGGEISAWNGPCYPYLGSWGCAKVINGTCHIWVQRDKLSDRLIRHEVAHCNGWKH